MAAAPHPIAVRFDRPGLSHPLGEPIHLVLTFAGPETGAKRAPSALPCDFSAALRRVEREFYDAA